MDNVPLVEFDLPQVEPWVFSIFGNTCMRRAFLQYEEGGSNGTVRPSSAFLRPVPRVGK